MSENVHQKPVQSELGTFNKNLSEQIKSDILLQRVQDLEKSSDRALPHSPHLEKSVISSMLKDPVNCVGTAIEKGVRNEVFYHPSHQVIYEFLVEAMEKNQIFDLFGYIQTLEDKNLLERVGGRQMISELYTFQPNKSHFENHLERVIEKYTLRKIIAKCSEAINQAYEQQDEVEALLDEVEQSVFAIREEVQQEESTSMKQSIEDVMDDFKNLMQNGNQVLGIETGYAQLDSMTGGLKPGELFVIAARPSMGKTSFMMNLVEHICLDQKLPTMVFSCEMTTKQIVQRLLFARARFEINTLKFGKPKSDKLKKINEASRELLHSKLFIDDTANISIAELRTKARRKKRDGDIKAIAVDYLQLMKSSSKQAQQSREREIAEISSGLKAIAKELNIPVIVLAQLNRGPENRTGGSPRMSDLRESGAIEQDADMIGLLYRTAYYADSEEQRQEQDGVAALTLAKNRNGATGEIPLTFIKGIMRFENSERKIEEA